MLPMFSPSVCLARRNMPAAYCVNSTHSAVAAVQERVRPSMVVMFEFAALARHWHHIQTLPVCFKSGRRCEIEAFKQVLILRICFLQRYSN